MVVHDAPPTYPSPQLSTASPQFLSCQSAHQWFVRELELMTSSIPCGVTITIVLNSKLHPHLTCQCPCRDDRLILRSHNVYSHSQSCLLWSAACVRFVSRFVHKFRPSNAIARTPWATLYVHLGLGGSTAVLNGYFRWENVKAAQMCKYLETCSIVGPPFCCQLDASGVYYVTSLYWGLVSIFYHKEYHQALHS